MQVSYEELIFDQQRIVPQLLRFANLAPDAEITRKFFSWTHGDSTVTGGFTSKIKRNASANIDHWKKGLPKSQLKIVNKTESCQLLINEIETRLAKLKKERVVETPDGFSL